MFDKEQHSQQLTNFGQPGRRSASAGMNANLDVVRLSDFWARMSDQFGPSYADLIAESHVFSGLGGKTIQQALRNGEDPKIIWRVVCSEFEVPARLR